MIDLLILNFSDRHRLVEFESVYIMPQRSSSSHLLPSSPPPTRPVEQQQQQRRRWLSSPTTIPTATATPTTTTSSPERNSSPNNNHYKNTGLLSRHRWRQVVRRSGGRNHSGAIKEVESTRASQDANVVFRTDDDESAPAVRTLKSLQPHTGPDHARVWHDEPPPLPFPDEDDKHKKNGTNHNQSTTTVANHSPLLPPQRHQHEPSVPVTNEKEIVPLHANAVSVPVLLVPDNNDNPSPSTTTTPLQAIDPEAYPEVPEAKVEAVPQELSLCKKRPLILSMLVPVLPDRNNNNNNNTTATSNNDDDYDGSFRDFAFEERDFECHEYHVSGLTKDQSLSSLNDDDSCQLSYSCHVDDPEDDRPLVVLEYPPASSPPAAGAVPAEVSSSLPSAPSETLAGDQGTDLPEQLQQQQQEQPSSLVEPRAIVFSEAAPPAHTFDDFIHQQLEGSLEPGGDETNGKESQLLSPQAHAADQPLADPGPLINSSSNHSRLVDPHLPAQTDSPQRHAAWEPEKEMEKTTSTVGETVPPHQTSANRRFSDFVRQQAQLLEEKHQQESAADDRHYLALSSSFSELLEPNELKLLLGCCRRHPSEIVLEDRGHNNAAHSKQQEAVQSETEAPKREKAKEDLLDKDTRKTAIVTSSSRPSRTKNHALKVNDETVVAAGSTAGAGAWRGRNNTSLNALEGNSSKKTDAGVGKVNGNKKKQGKKQKKEAAFSSLFPELKFGKPPKRDQAAAVSHRRISLPDIKPPFRTALSDGDRRMSLRPMEGRKSRTTNYLDRSKLDQNAADQALSKTIKGNDDKEEKKGNRRRSVRLLARHSTPQHLDAEEIAVGVTTAKGFATALRRSSQRQRPKLEANIKQGKEENNPPSNISSQVSGAGKQGSCAGHRDASGTATLPSKQVVTIAGPISDKEESLKPQPGELQELPMEKCATDELEHARPLRSEPGLSTRRTQLLGQDMMSLKKLEANVLELNHAEPAHLQDRSLLLQRPSVRMLAARFSAPPAKPADVIAKGIAVAASARASPRRSIRRPVVDHAPLQLEMDEPAPAEISGPIGKRTEIAAPPTANDNRTVMERARKFVNKAVQTRSGRRPAPSLNQMELPVKGSSSCQKADDSTVEASLTDWNGEGPSIRALPLDEHDFIVPPTLCRDDSNSHSRLLANDKATDSTGERVEQEAMGLCRIDGRSRSNPHKPGFGRSAGDRKYMIRRTPLVSPTPEERINIHAIDITAGEAPASVSVPDKGRVSNTITETKPTVPAVSQSVKSVRRVVMYKTSGRSRSNAYKPGQGRGVGDSQVVITRTPIIFTINTSARESSLSSLSFSVGERQLSQTEVEAPAKRKDNGCPANDEDKEQQVVYPQARPLGTSTSTSPAIIIKNPPHSREEEPTESPTESEWDDEPHFVTEYFEGGKVGRPLPVQEEDEFLEGSSSLSMGATNREKNDCEPVRRLVSHNQKENPLQFKEATFVSAETGSTGKKLADKNEHATIKAEPSNAVIPVKHHAESFSKSTPATPLQRNVVLGSEKVKKLSMNENGQIPTMKTDVFKQPTTATRLTSSGSEHSKTVTTRIAKVTVPVIEYSQATAEKPWHDSDPDFEADMKAAESAAAYFKRMADSFRPSK